MRGETEGNPWGCGEGFPSVSPRCFDLRYVPEPLESFPISPSGFPWGGGEIGNGGSGAPPPNPKFSATALPRVDRTVAARCVA